MAVSNHTGWCLDERQEGEVQVQSQEEQPREEKLRSERQLHRGACWGQPATTRNSEQAWTDSSLKPPEGAWPYWQLHCGFWSLQNFGRINSCCLKWPRLQLFVMGTLGNESNSWTNEMHRACQDTLRGPKKLKIPSALLFSVSFLWHQVLPLDTSFWNSCQFHEFLN